MRCPASISVSAALCSIAAPRPFIGDSRVRALFYGCFGPFLFINGYCGGEGQGLRGQGVREGQEREGKGRDNKRGMEEWEKGSG